MRLISENKLYLSIIFHFLGLWEFPGFLFFLFSSSDTQLDKKWAEVGSTDKGAATALHTSLMRCQHYFHTDQMYLINAS